MGRLRTFQQHVASLAVASLIIGTQLTAAGPAAASRYNHHGSSFSYGYGGYRPHYASRYRYPYRHGYGYDSYRYGRQSYRYGHHGYGYPYRRHGGVSVGIHGHGSSGAVAVGALGVGLLLGHLLTRPQRRAVDRTYYQSSRASSSAPTLTRAHTVSPIFGYGKQVRRDCKPTTGSGLHQGRRATFGGTYCYAANGQGYIVPGSEYLIGYAN